MKNASRTQRNSLDDVPRFQQIAAFFKAKINNELVPHEPLPSERGVAEQFGVSRMTARRALEAIEAEGLAYSEGRRGRFVSPQRLRYDINRISFAADATDAGIDLNIELLHKARVRATPVQAKALQLAPNTPLHSYRRLFCTDGHTTFIETEHLELARFPDLLQQDLQQSTSKLLQAHYGVRAESSNIVIRLRALSDAEAQVLGVKAQQAGVELEQTSYDHSGKAICLSQQIWRGEQAEFAATAVTTTE